MEMMKILGLKAKTFDCFLFLLVLLSMKHICLCSMITAANSTTTTIISTINVLSANTTNAIVNERINESTTGYYPSTTSPTFSFGLSVSSTKTNLLNATKSTNTTMTNTQQPKETQKRQTKNKWSVNSDGNQNQLPYKLNCSLNSMMIQVNFSSLYGPNLDINDDEPYVYLEKLRSFSICRPKIQKFVATFHLSLDDDFYRCGTTKVHDQITGRRIFYNRVVVESKRGKQKQRSIYFKCSQPNLDRMFGFQFETEDATSATRTKRSESWIEDSSGRLVNFTEIDLPENFMEAEVLDFTDNITARAPYPHLNLKVKRNGHFVNTSFNVAPGTPLEMIIYLDDESKHVYGLLASFMKVTDNSNRQQEVIVLNGCSIDPYIFGNFETEDNGDSISAKFRAFKFPESNYVMFIGTVNVCLDQCKKVPCGNGIYGLGRRKRSLSVDLPKDPNKVFEIEMMAYLRIGYSEEEMATRRASIQASFTGITSSSSASIASLVATKPTPNGEIVSELKDESPSAVMMMPQYESLTSSASSLIFNFSGQHSYFLFLISVLSSLLLSLL